MKRHLVPRIVTKLIIPLILLFGLYIQFHGDFTAGGGFQAGVIFAAGFILYNIIFGIKVGQSILSINMTKNLMAVGLLLYIFVGFLGILLGGNFLDYNPLSSNSVQGQLIGVFLIELSVGLTVSNAMILIFYSFNDTDQEQV
jgi:multicomponent Na+:H+ antiporter subunit B